jgi:hypothetical protein
MTALYLLANEYRAAALKLADLDLDAQTVADTLDGMAGEVEVKAQNVAFMVRAIEADAEAMNDWARKAIERGSAAMKRAAAIRDYLARCMEASGIQKIEGAGVKLSFRPSSAVVIDALDLLPSEFLALPVPQPLSPDKTAIKAAFKAGKDVPGAHIEHRMNLQIT